MAGGIREAIPSTHSANSVCFPQKASPCGAIN